MGEVSPRPRGGATAEKIDLIGLRRLVEEQPDATIKDLRQHLSVDCTESAVGMALRRLGLS